MENQSHLFSLPEGIHYLNCATMSPLLKSVEEAGIKGVLRKSQPYNITQENFFDTFELVKTEFGKLINCSDVDRIALMGSASYAMATVTKNIIHKGLAKAGKKIVLVGEEFPSGVYAWDELVGLGVTIEFIKAPATLEDRGEKWNENFINAIDKNTLLVCLSPNHWSDGTKYDLKAIDEKCKTSNALFVIDGTQYIGAHPFDVSEISPILVVSAVYKWMLGPYGNPLCYLSEWFDDGVPLEQNWALRKDSNDFKNLINYQSEYRPKAYRYNLGEFSNFINMPMILAALQQLNDWTPYEIQNYAKELSSPYVETIKTFGYWVEDENFRCHHMFGIKLPVGKDIKKIQQNLMESKTYVSFRGDAIRVSVNVWNTNEDMELLVKCLNI
jgi:selenocysteine lyase/cysteine desulfurase